MRQQEQQGTAAPKMADTRRSLSTHDPHPPPPSHKLPRSDSMPHMGAPEPHRGFGPKEPPHPESGHNNSDSRSGNSGSASVKSRTAGQNLSGIQKQLIDLAHVLQEKQGRMTLEQLADALNVPNDGSTRVLLENLNSQLSRAVTQGRRDSPAPLPPHMRREESKTDSRSGNPGQKDDSGGVQAALAQLLAQQGVKVGAKPVPPSSGNSGSHRYSSGSQRLDQDDSSRDSFGDRYSGGRGGVPPLSGDSSFNNPAPRSRQYSQQSSYNTQPMSISEGSNSPYSYDNSNSQRSRREELLNPEAEQLSVKAKVENYFDKYGQEEPRPVPGTDPAFRTGGRSGGHMAGRRPASGDGLSRPDMGRTYSGGSGGGGRHGGHAWN